MSALLSKIGAVMIIVPQCAIVAEQIPELQEKVKQCFQDGEKKIVFDLSIVSHVDSKGLEFLLDIFEESRTRGGGLKLSKVNPLCKDIFIATRMSNLLEIFKEPEEAARSFL